MYIYTHTHKLIINIRAYVCVCVFAQTGAIAAYAARVSDGGQFRAACVSEHAEMSSTFGSGLAFQRCNPMVVYAAKQILGHAQYALEFEYCRKDRISITETVAPVDVIRDCSICTNPVDGVNRQWRLLHDPDPARPDVVHQMCNLCLVAVFTQAAASGQPARCPLCRVPLNPALNVAIDAPVAGPYDEAFKLLSQFTEGKGIVKMRISDDKARFKILLKSQPNCIGDFNGVKKATANTVLTAARQCTGRIGGYLSVFTNVPAHKKQIRKSIPIYTVIRITNV